MSDIFQEIPDEIDEDWKWGAIVGGWSSENLVIARAYRTAGDWLVDKGLREEEMYEVAYPILFLYRHSIELYLKAIARDHTHYEDVSRSAKEKPNQRSPGHRLLIDELKEVVQLRFRQKLPARLLLFLEGFARNDPDSQTFRYEDGPKSGAELWADLRQAKVMMDVLVKGLERIIHEVRRGPADPNGS